MEGGRKTHTEGAGGGGGGEAGRQAGRHTHTHTQERHENIAISTDFIVITIDRFYVALFLALEQTQCARVACDSERVTVSFYRH